MQTRIAKQPIQIELKLQTEEPSLLQEIFGVEMPTGGVESTLAPGILIRASRVEVEHGLIESSIIVTCILQAASGIATKVIADVLLDRIRARKAKLNINGKPVSNLTAPALASAVEGAANAAR